MHVTENATDQPNAPHTLLSKRFTVFLVDDNRDDLHHMMAVLRRSPYIGEIHCFCNGDDMRKHFVLEGYYSAGQQLQEHAMILLDVHMPGTDGLSLLRELKEHPHTAAIPVLLTTSDMSSDIRNTAETLHVEGYAAKPVHINHVHDIMRQRGHNIPECVSTDRR